MPFLAAKRSSPLGRRRLGITPNCWIAAAPQIRTSTETLNEREEVIHTMATHKVTRDSRTGQFVPPKEAIRRPATTTTETVRTPNKGK